MCVFLTAFFGVCDCLLTDDRNLMNLFQCLRFDASSPAFLCHVISLQAFEPQLKTTGCMVTHYPCRLDGHHHFPVLSSSVGDFEEGPRYTNSHRRFGLIRLHPGVFSLSSFNVFIFYNKFMPFLLHRVTLSNMLC